MSNTDKTVLGARVYEGNGDVNILIAVCEKDLINDNIRYAYCYENEDGKRLTVGNNQDYQQMLGEPFDRSVLEKMECMERFLVNHGDVKIHAVREAGIRRCLEEWRRGVEAFATKEQFFISSSTGKTEYVYQISPENDNIYCVVKRYKDEEIVLAGCGDEEYRFRKNDNKLERFA